MNKKPEWSKERLLRMFFRSTQRLERLTKLKVPSEVIQNEARFRNDLLGRLSSAGIDGQEYFNSSAGQAEYVAFCVEEDHTDKLFDRCHRCLNYFLTDGVEECSIYKDKMPMKCTKFMDSGVDFDIRIIEAMSRCEKCVHARTINIKEIDMDYDTCSLKLNELNIICDKFREKT